jgi:hypothetical protein
MIRLYSLRQGRVACSSVAVHARCFALDSLMLCAKHCNRLCSKELCKCKHGQDSAELVLHAYPWQAAFCSLMYVARVLLSCSHRSSNWL